MEMDVHLQHNALHHSILIVQELASAIQQVNIIAQV